MLTYDALPYDTKPSFLTHPDRITAVARLYGLATAEPTQCRVLEIGCGTGANLLPMAAALPGSTFVGIDLSPVQIRMGQAAATSLDLQNLHLHTADLTTWQPDAPFDHVVVHGVYSWLPEGARDALMALIRRSLAPQGVAVVSYNTLPGWHIRGALRELLRFHTREVAEPSARVARARQLLGTLAASAPGERFASLMVEVARDLVGAADSYLLHDYLADDNHPVHFHTFVEHAHEHGMTWIAEAELGASNTAHLADGGQRLLQQLPDDGFAGHQFADFVRNRTFRRSLLCLDEAGLRGEPDASALRQLYFVGRMTPEVASYDLTSDNTLTFVRDGEPVMSTDTPMLKAALAELAAHMPAARSFDQLCDGAWHRLGQTGRCPDEARDYLQSTLMAVVTHNFAGLLARDPAAAAQLGPKPLVWRVAREQAAAGGPFVASLHHRPVGIDAFDRALIPLLDGTRDRATLMADLSAALPQRAQAELATAVIERLPQLVAAALFHR